MNSDDGINYVKISSPFNDMEILSAESPAFWSAVINSNSVEYSTSNLRAIVPSGESIELILISSQLGFSEGSFNANGRGIGSFPTQNVRVPGDSSRTIPEPYSIIPAALGFAGILARRPRKPSNYQK